MVSTILSSPLFVEGILPFLLVFAVVFAVLQKSEILGKGKKQVDALVALAAALLVLAFGNAVGIIVQLTAFLGVGLVILLVLMLLVGMFHKQGDFNNAFGGWLQKTVVAIIFAAVVIAVLYVTKLWDWVIDKIFGVSDQSTLLANIILMVVVVAAVVIAWKSGNSDSKEEEEKKEKGN